MVGIDDVMYVNDVDEYLDNVGDNFYYYYFILM